MTTLFHSSPALIALLCLISFIITAVSMYMSTDVYTNHESQGLKLEFTTHTALSAIFLVLINMSQIVLYYRRQYDNEALHVADIFKSNWTNTAGTATVFDRIIDMPVPVAIVIIVVFGATLILLMKSHTSWREDNLAQSSLKEAIDNLPIGLCFYTESGKVMLANNIIQKLSKEITGSLLWNPIQLIEKLRNDNPYVTKNGKVYMFDIAKLDGGYMQLSAFDVTETYNLMTELTEENKKLEEMNSHMREYNMMVDQTIKKEEQLDTRIRIHDDLGRILLSTKVYLKRDDDFITKSDLLAKWNQTLHLLQGEAKHNKNSESVQLLTDAAAQVGIKLEFIGEMPTDNRLLHILISGCRECITNSAHADASKLTINIQDEEDCKTFTFTDDAAPPEYPIREGGGLSSLRQIVEREGVKMEIASSGKYFLRLTIPKEV